MIDLRFVKRIDPETQSVYHTLQYRIGQITPMEKGDLTYVKYTDWRDVPVEDETDADGG